MHILWDELLTFIVCNIFWLLLCLPVVTAPASCAALYYVADLAARRKPVSYRDFFSGARQYLIKGTLLGLINVLVIALLAINVLFYTQMQSGLAPILRAAWLAVCVFWGMVQIYLFPLLVVQIEPKVLWALRSAVMLSLAQPIFTFTIALTAGGLLALSLSLVIPFLTIGMSATALLSCVALNDRLDALGIRQKQAEQRLGRDENLSQ